MTSQYPNYNERAQECIKFLEKNYPGTLCRVLVNSDPKWVWFNGDGDIFTFDSQKEAAADLAMEMGITKAELESV